MGLPNLLVDGVPVDLLYPIADLKHSTGFYIEEKAEGSPSPSGDLRASVTLACPRDFQANWMLPGKSFKLYEYGTLRWSGVTTEPERADGQVTVHAEGVGSVLKDWTALYDPGTGEQPTFVPNDAVDYAQSLGAPFGRYGVDLGSTAIVLFSNTSATTDLLTLLTRAAIIQGKRLHVDSFGAITYKATPTTPTWMMTPQTDYFGTADEQFVTTLRGYYLRYGEAHWRIEILGSPTGGTWAVSGNGQTATGISRVASATTVQTAVRGLGGVFSAAVVTSPSASVWDVSVESGGGVLTVASSLTGGTDPRVAIEQTYGDGIVKAEDTAAAAKFGIRQRTIDLTNLGPMTTAQAQAYIDGRFALIGARMGWTTQAELNSNNLMHVSGVWSNPRNVRAGDMLIIPGVIDARSNPTIRGSIQWVGQEVEITEGSEPTATVTPVGFVPRDFDGLLAPPENPATKEAA